MVSSNSSPVVLLGLGLGSGVSSTPGLRSSVRLSGGIVAIAILIRVETCVLIDGPSVIISLGVAEVVLFVVGLGVDGIVRLSVSGVVVSAVSTLGPGVVVVATLGGLPFTGGTLGSTVVLSAILSTVTLVTVLLGG